MAQTNVQVLQSDLQAIAKTYQDLAERILAFSRHLHSTNPTDLENLPQEMGWKFPVNDYSTLSTWLTKDPWALENKSKWKTESWPAYAARLTTYVGWDVDSKTLRRSLERRQGC